MIWLGLAVAVAQWLGIAVQVCLLIRHARTVKRIGKQCAQEYARTALAEQSALILAAGMFTERMRWQRAVRTGNWEDVL
jgi:hypothetical protein